MKKIVKSVRPIYFALRDIRMYFLRKVYGLNNVSKSFYLGGKSAISKDFVAGDFSYVGPNCNIGPKVKIGNYTMLANNVSVIGDDHIFSKSGTPIIFSGRPILRETVIGDDVWVGAFSIVLAGTKIGNGSIIGAGSVVTRDVPPYSVFAGVPARFIKMRFNEQYEIRYHEEMLSQRAIMSEYCRSKN